jgi:enterochelin esterase-like enzyme
VKIVRRYVALVAVIALNGWSSWAQQPTNPAAASTPEAGAPARVPAGPPPAGFGGNRGPKSPEIGADGSVVFRLLAPDATAVSLGGSWQVARSAPVAMTKDEKGVWSATVPAIKPEVYTYTFNVDGARMLDPGNVNVQRDGTRYLSMLLVPGVGSAMYETGDVPHGTVNEVWYASPTLGMPQRRMYVYTPAGYDDSKDKYPVLYLLHGAGGDEDAWDSMGRTHEIFDHMIASGKAKPMIVVETNGNYNQTAAPGVTPQDPGNGMTPAPGSAPWMNSTAPMLRFTDSLISDVVPYVEKHYRVIADRDHRAVAGLSMGGAQTILVGARNMDKFSYMASFSGAFILWPGVSTRPVGGPGAPAAPTGANPAAGDTVAASGGAATRAPRANVTPPMDMDAVAKTFPDLNASANAKLHLLYISCGEDDGLLGVNEQFMSWLTTQGVTYKKMTLPGYAHVWPFWRVSLIDLMPQLFTADTATIKTKSKGGR